MKKKSIYFNFTFCISIFSTSEKLPLKTIMMLASKLFLLNWLSCFAFVYFSSIRIVFEKSATLDWAGLSFS